MIGLVLIQHGKGADMGASFGSGASGSLFGATGSANFLSRSTAVCAAVFFACTLALAYFANDRARPAPTAACSSAPASARRRPAPAAPPARRRSRARAALPRPPRRRLRAGSACGRSGAAQIPPSDASAISSRERRATARLFRAVELRHARDQ